tara:strand:+ start:8959 stop:10293 length:1335 start_codon:yes stop_codon:yes gene_type:complete
MRLTKLSDHLMKMLKLNISKSVHQRFTMKLILGSLVAVSSMVLIACELDLPDLEVDPGLEPEVVIEEKIIEVEKIVEVEVEKIVDNEVIVEVEKLIEVEADTIVVDSPDETKSGQGEWELDVDLETGFMTLLANEASLLEILRELKTEYQIDVIVSKLVDIRVTIDIDSVPLDEGLATLIPSDSRFHFRVEGRDLLIEGKPGEQIAAKQLEPAQTDLPNKDQRTRPRSDGELNTESKIPPEKVQERQTDGGRGAAKVHPEKILEGSLDLDAIVANPSLSGENSYARVVLHIALEGVTPTGFLEVEGSLVQPTNVKGELIYVASVNGIPVAVGSQQDPLALHTAGEGHEHMHEKLEEGIFLISLPEQFLVQTTLESSSIVFYYLEPVGPIPSVLSTDTISYFKPHLKAISRIGGDEIIAIKNRQEVLTYDDALRLVGLESIGERR